MLITEREKMSQDIRQWAERYGKNRSALIPVLQEVQRRYRWINEYAMQSVADLLGIHPVEVYGVVSFYSFLHDKPYGRFVIRLCRTISCEMKGMDHVARQLENDLGVEFGQTTPDGMFTLEWANCLGMCDQGPAMLVNDQVFTRVTPEKTHDILQGCRMQMSAHATARREGQVI